MEFGLSDERLRTAIRLSNEAAAKDSAGHLPEAFELYKRALENWRIVCKCKSAFCHESLGLSPFFWLKLSGSNSLDASEASCPVIGIWRLGSVASHSSTNFKVVCRTSSTAADDSQAPLPELFGFFFAFV